MPTYETPACSYTISKSAKDREWQAFDNNGRRTSGDSPAIALNSLLSIVAKDFGVKESDPFEWYAEYAVGKITAIKTNDPAETWLTRTLTVDGERQGFEKLAHFVNPDERIIAAFSKFLDRNM